MAPSLRHLYRHLRYGQPIVVVSGLPRSGTSMVMKMLEAGGLAVLTDGLRTADEDNPKGYYEVERVKNLGTESDKSWLAEARGKGIKVISYLLRSLPPRFNYRVVFIRREMEEVLASQRKMLARRSETSSVSDEEMEARFREHLKVIKYWLARQPNMDVLYVDYNRMMADPDSYLQKIVDFVGLPLDTAKMRAVPNEGLYRNRAGSS